MNDFNKDDNFENFDDNNFDNFNSGNSLKDVWQNNPMLKLFAVAAVVVLGVSALFIFGGSSDKANESKVSTGVDQNETLGGDVSSQYAQAIEDVNNQRYEQATQTGDSTIPMLVNPQDQQLLTDSEDLPPYQDMDPLASFRATIKEEEAQEPQLVQPDQVFQQQPVQSVPAPTAETVQTLAQAMSQSASDILANHVPKAGRITQITPPDYFEQLAAAQLQAQAQNTDQTGQMVDTNGDGIPDTPYDVTAQDDGNVVIQSILIPAGTINYAQVLIEANSDVPGPVLVQLVSGPLAGARLIGQFRVQNDFLVLQFSSIVVDGLNQPVNAIALDPNTTLPGVASEVDQRYFSRVVLPAAARFLQGMGSAIAEDTQTTVTVSGDTVIEQKEALDLEQELGRGAEAAFDEVATFMDEEADKIEPLVRVARGTPIGVFFLEPVLEETDQ